MPDHAPPAQKAAHASATVASTAGISAVVPVLTQRVLRLQILDCHVLMTPAVGPVSPGLGWFELLNLLESQESRLSSVQLSPNRVWPDFDVDTEDLYPLFDTSPVSDGDLSLMSPATTQESISPDSEGEAESFHSAGVSPATSLTALRSCSSCRRCRLLFLRQSRSKRIPPCCFDSPQLITSGFLSLRRILCPSRLHLCSARATCV